MTDGIDLSALISDLGGGGDLASKLSTALGGDGASALPDALKNADLSALLSSLGAASGTVQADADGGSTGSASADGSARDANNEGGAGLAPSLPSVVAALTRGGDERSKQRRALLSAIRPFVSDRRKSAIDALVGIEKLTAVLPGVK